jgi:DNA invertase Pin-like site-specific DNA recombinase
MKQYVLYLRRSKPEEDGYDPYSIDVQRQMAYSVVGKENVVKEFVEIKTAFRNKKRPIFDEALEYCINNNIHLAVMVDRMVRSLEFYFQIRRMIIDNGLDIVFTDYPNASKEMIIMKIMWAEMEVENTSKRIKRTLDYVKKNGSRSGKPIGNINIKKIQPIASQKGAQMIHLKAISNENNKKAFAVMKQMKHDSSLSEISNYLNENGFKTSKGNKWSKQTVRRVHKMMIEEGL